MPSTHILSDLPTNLHGLLSSYQSIYYQLHGKEARRPYGPPFVHHCWDRLTLLDIEHASPSCDQCTVPIPIFIIMEIQHGDELNCYAMFAAGFDSPMCWHYWILSSRHVSSILDWDGTHCNLLTCSTTHNSKEKSVHVDVPDWSYATSANIPLCHAAFKRMPLHFYDEIYQVLYQLWAVIFVFQFLSTPSIWSIAM